MARRLSGLAPAALAAFVLCGIAPTFANGPMVTTSRPTYTPPQSYMDPNAAAAAEAAAAANAAAISNFNPPPASPNQDNNMPPPDAASAPPPLPPGNIQNSDAPPPPSVIVTTYPDPNTGDTIRYTNVSVTNPDGTVTVTDTRRDMTTGMVLSRTTTTFTRQNTADPQSSYAETRQSTTNYGSNNQITRENAGAWSEGSVTTTTAPSSADLRKQTLKQLGIGQ
jgi:hypothetical protein